MVYYTGRRRLKPFSRQKSKMLCIPTFCKFSPFRRLSVVGLLTRGAWDQGRRVASMHSFPPEPDHPPFRHHEVRHDVGTLSKGEEALSLDVRSSDFNPVATLLTVPPPPSLAVGHPVPAPGSAHLQQPHHAGKRPLPCRSPKKKVSVSLL